MWKVIATEGRIRVKTSDVLAEAVIVERNDADERSPVENWQLLFDGSRASLEEFAAAASLLREAK